MPEVDSSKLVNWKNLKEFERGLFSAGKPAEEDIAAAAEAGVKCLVCVSDRSEFDYDVQAAAENRGLRFEYLPVNGPQDVTDENARRLDALLSEEANQPMIIHCGSGNRVGALYALRESCCQGADMAAALAAGRRAGLAGLEGFVAMQLA
ncbi:MAG: sulfur transferase domain-containing protein [Gammaproteobacteria bacterium]|nr:sulfur transferase domain-containing protein [Gammaproteobacteria bacterium]